MSHESREYVRYRLERAAQALEAASASAERALNNDAVNRIYYACFYAVSALLISTGLSSSKHSGVRSMFERYYVKDGPLPKKYGRFYHQLFDARQDCDYTDFVTFSEAEVSALLERATDFVGAVSVQVRFELEKQGD